MGSKRALAACLGGVQHGLHVLLTLPRDAGCTTVWRSGSTSLTEVAEHDGATAEARWRCCLWRCSVEQACCRVRKNSTIVTGCAPVLAVALHPCPEWLSMMVVTHRIRQLYF